jgi:RimJ/RimL family protein N-acetyltransferase
VTAVTFPDCVPVLGDGLVTLRAHRPSDVDAVLEQCVDPVSQRWTTVPVPYTREHAVGFVTQVVPDGWARGSWAFAVEAPGEDGTPRYCGTVDLRDQDGGRAEIAFGAHPWARGRGVMVRALSLLLDWGFAERGLRTVVWWANTGNWASRRTAWRLGFSCDGTVPGYLPQRGDLLDGWVGVLRAGDERAPRGPWLQVPRLAGERVALRPFRDTDAPRVVEACGDARTAHWLWRMPSPYTLSDAHDYLESRTEELATASGLTWAVADPATDVLLGAISVFDLKLGRDGVIGYWTHPAARGRGVMTEACGLVLRHCFTPADRGGLGLVRMGVGAAAGNTASQHVIERNGFRPVGRQRSALLLGDGSLTDLLDYDLLREEYDASGASAS